MKTRALILALACGLLPALACNYPDNLSPYVTPFTSTPPPLVELYVATTGDDANDCLSVLTPCLTVNSAVGKAPPDGGMIILAAGIYVEDDPASDAGLIVRDKHVIIRSSAASGDPIATISGGGAADAVTITGRASVTIWDLAIADGGGTRGAGVYLDGDGEPAVRFFNVWIQDNAGVGLHVRGNGTAYLDDMVWIRRNNGGILNEGGIVVGNGTRIVENVGTSSAIDNRAPGAIKIEDSLIADNQSDAAGTAIANADGAAFGMDRSAVVRNTLSPASSFTDSAVHNRGNMLLQNSTVSENTGAGVANDGNLRILFMTIATNGGNGLILGTADTDLTNSIIENNGLQDCLFGAGAAAATAGAVLSDESCTTGAGAGYVRPPEGDSHLASLADNGGPTPTHALLEGNRGIDAAEGECLPTDQRGETRPFGAGCDAGAFELQGDEVTPVPTLLPPSVTPTLAPTPTPTLPLQMEPPGYLKVAVKYCSANGFAVALEWGAAKDTLGYRIYRDGVLLATVGPTVTSYVDVLPDFHNHTYRVEAFNKYAAASTTAQASGECKPVTGATQITPATSTPTRTPLPPLPVNPPGYLKVTVKYCSANGFAVVLEWGAAKGALGYRIYRDGPLLTTVGSSVTSHVDVLPDFHSHSYRVEAFNKDTAASTTVKTSGVCKP
jgi:hypothetical protein